MIKERYDKIILGAGMYGLYAAGRLAKKGCRTLVIDMESRPFQRGSYINQARLHNGYHYPRSYTTAFKSAGYFSRFMEDFGEACVNTEFEQIYAIAREYSWTNARQFERFCSNLHVRCERMLTEKYFNTSTVEAAFITQEHSFDAELLSRHLYEKAKEAGCAFALGVPLCEIRREDGAFRICLKDGSSFEAPFVLNATYAGTNEIHRMLGYEMLPVKYELCEVILCQVTEQLKNVGLTVMDGPFFSVMPFGRTGFHSITTVSRTPHMTCYDPLPAFPCQKDNPDCTPEQAANCNACISRPETAFQEMKQIARKYLREAIDLSYVKSLFTLKPILKASEIDDSRPTIIRKYSGEPDFYTVFSGKINTMYDLDEIL